MENMLFNDSINVTYSQELITTERVGFVAFCSDFDKQLDKLKVALAKSPKAQTRAGELNEKGAWHNLVGSISGRNDKNMSSMIEMLGVSLEITQGILELVLTVQNTKKLFLRDFHKALVNKVALIKDDTTMLDTNLRQATIAILSELCDLVADQIERQAIIDNHQKKLQQLDGYVAQKDVLDQEQSHKINLLESRALQIIRADEEQQRSIEDLKAAHASKDKIDRIQTQRIDILTMAIINLEVDTEKYQRTIGILENRHNLLMQQLQALEAQICRGH